MGNLLNFKKSYNTLKIIITKENKLKCCFYNCFNIQVPIEIIEKQQEYDISIAFDVNDIIYCRNHDKSIEFIEEWINQPDEYKLYHIQYQEKEYFAIAEVLFALIIKHFKSKVDNQTIFQHIDFELPKTTTQMFNNRLKMALEMIGNHESSIDYVLFDYKEQFEIFNEIQTKYEEVQKFKNKLEKAKELVPYLKKKELLEFDKDKIYDIQTRENEMMKFNWKEKRQMNLFTLDNYSIFLASQYFNTIDDHINLVRVCKRLRCNMERFDFNPIPLTPLTRPFFPNINTLFQYNLKDNLFPSDKKIHRIKKCKNIKYDLWDDEIKQLEKWTKLSCGNVLFDSYFCDWKTSKSLNNRIIGKEHLLFVIEDVNNEKFGYYLNSKVANRFYCQLPTDKYSFHFNLESNTRLPSPMKFEINDTEWGGYQLWKEEGEWLIWIGEMSIGKESLRKRSKCWQQTKYFNYHGYKSALCGNKVSKNGMIDFVPKRIMVIQME